MQEALKKIKKFENETFFSKKKQARKQYRTKIHDM
jgi:hypothetical protein